METPSSARRVTRSQSSYSSQKKMTKEDETLPRLINNGNHERAALHDISNDSPIIGIATEMTPLASSIKQGASSIMIGTSSGEALLRGQAKILLEKVEEEAELVNKLSNRCYPTFFPAVGIHPISPSLLGAPTPANTPLFFDVLETIKEPRVVKVAEPVRPEQLLEPMECVINRALLFDSPDKSEATDFSSVVSSSLTYQGIVVSPSYDEHCSSWSVQANASAFEEDDDKDHFEGMENEEYESFFEEKSCIDELCDGVKNITVEGDVSTKMPEFTGKHTRFKYNSDDEIEGEEEIGPEGRLILSPNVMLLRGLPVPEGKHLRFIEEDAE